MGKKEEPLVPILGRCDLVTMANIVKWMDLNGIRPRNKSDFLFRATELLNKILLTNGEIDPVPNKTEAVGILSRNNMSWGDDSVGHAEIIKNLSLDALHTTETEMHNPQSVDKGAITRKIVEEQIRKMREQDDNT